MNGTELPSDRKCKASTQQTFAFHYASNFRAAISTNDKTSLESFAHFGSVCPPPFSDY